MSTKKIHYIAAYNKANYQMYPFRVRKSDTELIDKLNSVKNRNRYLTDLVLNDLDSGILTIKQIKDRIKELMKIHQIQDVYLFGSYARGEATRGSDVDLYCSRGDIVSLYDEVDFVQALEKSLGKKVDLVTIGSEMPGYFREQIEEDMIKLW